LAARLVPVRLAERLPRRLPIRPCENLHATTRCRHSTFPSPRATTTHTRPQNMAWYDEDSWATAAFAPRLPTILVTFALAVLLPILLHQFIYRRATPTTLPTFLLLGPSGAGKTALLTLVRIPHPTAYSSKGAANAISVPSPCASLSTPAHPPPPFSRNQEHRPEACISRVACKCANRFVDRSIECI